MLACHVDLCSEIGGQRNEASLGREERTVVLRRWEAEIRGEVVAASTCDKRKDGRRR